VSERSLLRVRERDHIHPQRKGEVVWEVVRDGEVVATIYGSREGVHIVSERLGPSSRNRPFLLEVAGKPSWVIPLLDDNEVCPWCQGTEVANIGVASGPCPICVQL